jgi:hypothetical protein
VSGYDHDTAARAEAYPASARALQGISRGIGAARLPVDKHGHIDLELWRKHREACRVRRFWGHEEDAVGHLVHKPGGTEHAHWEFEYGPGAEDDEAGFRLDAHTFSPGEYVSIQDHGGELHTFVVMFVEAIEK